MKELTPDEAAASLAFANQIQENMIPQGDIQDQDSPESPEMAQGEAETQDMGKDIDEVVEAKVEEKIGELREELMSALSDEDEEDGTEED